MLGGYQQDNTMDIVATLLPKLNSSDGPYVSEGQIKQLWYELKNTVNLLQADNDRLKNKVSDLETRVCGLEGLVFRLMDRLEIMEQAVAMYLYETDKPPKESEVNGTQNTGD